MEQKTQFEQWKELALACGFTSAWMLDTETLVFRPEVRAMCADDKCHRFGKCWTCPPACGTIEEAAEKASAFHRGILVQTVAQLEDCFDSEGIEEAGRRHKESFDCLLLRLRSEGLNLLPMGMGACTRCGQCTYPDQPCRFPELAYPSMEAYGLVVSEVCKRNGAPYYNGPDTVTFSSCMLVE